MSNTTPSWMSSASTSGTQNPIFSQIISNALFQQVASSPEEANQQQAHQNIIPQKGLPTHVHVNDNSIDVTPEEFLEIQTWVRKLKYGYIAISTFLVITALLSFVSLTVITSGFIAFYLLMFSCLICCYEIGIKFITKQIVQNFGFLYNGKGRLAFLIFVAVLSFSLGIMGIISFSLLLAAASLEIYLRFKHPEMGNYMSKLHYYNSVVPRVK